MYLDTIKQTAMLSVKTCFRMNELDNKGRRRVIRELNKMAERLELKELKDVHFDNMLNQLKF